MKILIVKRDKIGDMLLTTPALRVLRAALNETSPGSEIHLLASGYNAWVVAENNDVDHLWTYQRVRTGRRVDFRAAWGQLKLFFALRREGFDVAIAAGGNESPRALKRALAVGAKRTIGYTNESIWRRRLTDSMLVPVAGHETLRIANQLTPLGVELPLPLPPPVFESCAGSREFAIAFMNHHQLEAGKFAVIGTGARFPEKQPSASQILTWAEHLFNCYHLKTVLVWTPGGTDSPLYRGDDQLAAEVMRSKPDYLIALTPASKDVRKIIAVIAQAKTSIFPDSGLMHFAAATPGGVIGLFASTWAEPDQWAPVGERARAIVNRLALAEWPDHIVIDAIGAQLNTSNVLDG